MQIKDSTLVLYEPGTSNLNGIVMPDGTLLHTGGVTVEERMAEHPELQLMTFTEAEIHIRGQEDKMCTPLVEIPWDAWNEAFSVLPPMFWVMHRRGFEAFTMQEAFCADIHSIYLRNRHNNRCYTAYRRVNARSYQDVYDELITEAYILWAEAEQND